MQEEYDDDVVVAVVHFFDDDFVVGHFFRRQRHRLTVTLLEVEEDPDDEDPDDEDPDDPKLWNNGIGSASASASAYGSGSANPYANDWITFFFERMLTKIKKISHKNSDKYFLWIKKNLN